MTQRTSRLIDPLLASARRHPPPPAMQAWWAELYLCSTPPDQWDILNYASQHPEVEHAKLSRSWLKALQTICDGGSDFATGDHKAKAKKLLHLYKVVHTRRRARPGKPIWWSHASAAPLRQELSVSLRATMQTWSSVGFDLAVRSDPSIGASEGPVSPSVVKVVFQPDAGLLGAGWPASSVRSLGGRGRAHPADPSAHATVDTWCRARTRIVSATGDHRS